MGNDNLIYVLNKTLALHQSPQGFRTSMDSVMLAAACPAQEGTSVLDLGCGVGSAGLCVLKRVQNATLTGVDIQQDHIELAAKNAALNNMSDRAGFICGDVRNADLPRADHVICNPPYMEAGAHISSPSESKARAMGHIEDDMTIQDWITCAHRHIKGQGSLTMIYDAGQSDMLIHALYGKNGGRRFGGVEIIPLFPRDGVPAKRVIIRAYKHKKSKATLYPGIIMHQENGDYTDAANKVLRGAEQLYPLISPPKKHPRENGDLLLRSSSTQIPACAGMPKGWRGHLGKMGIWKAGRLMWSLDFDRT